MATDPNFALYPSAQTEIAPLVGVVDAWPNQEHRLEMAATDVPVESGGTITDNAVVRPQRLTLHGLVADILPAPGNEAKPGGQRSAEAWERILAFFAAREPVDVVTPFHVYRHMLPRRALASSDVTTGRALRFELQLSEILFVPVDRVRVDPGAVASDGPAADRTSAVDAGQRESASYPAPVLP